MFYTTPLEFEFERSTMPVRRAVLDPPGGRGLIVGAGLGRSGPGMARALTDANHDVRVFGRVTSALRQLERLQPDTVVVGFDEGPGAASTLLSQAREAGVHAVMALVDESDGGRIDHALASGAHDVVAPPHSARAILLRRKVLLQALSAPPPISTLKHRVVLGPLTVDLTTRQVLDGAEPLTLSGREFELLVRLMEAQGDVVTRTELLCDIWGAEQGSEAVLDATVHRLRRKLDEKLDDEPLIATVRGVGYRLRADPYAVQPLSA